MCFDEDRLYAMPRIWSPCPLRLDKRSAKNSLWPMPIYKLTINDEPHRVDAPEDMPLLWVLRDRLALKGTKFGCGFGICGACTVHLNGDAQPACMVRIADVGTAAIVTIKGLGKARLHPLQQAWLAAAVPQCGYCQAGMLMAVSALLKRMPHPTRAELDVAIGNICRCGTYPKILAAIADVTGLQL